MQRSCNTSGSLSCHYGSTGSTNVRVSLIFSGDNDPPLTIVHLRVRRHDLGEPCVPSQLPTPEGWTSHIHPQGWVYFYHPKTRMVTNDDIRTPSILNTLESYIATYPFCDLADGMELRLPYDPQPDEHMFSLIVNHKSCMAGYSMKDVKSTEGMKADNGAFNPMGIYTLLTRVLSEQTAKDVLELPRKIPKSRPTSSERRAGSQRCPSLVSSWYPVYLLAAIFRFSFHFRQPRGWVSQHCTVFEAGV